MSVEVKKQARENVGTMLRRFTRKVQLSGILLSARKSRFYSRKRSKSLRRKDALYRDKAKKERTRLEKLGLIE